MWCYPLFSSISLSLIYKFPSQYIFIKNPQSVHFSGWHTMLILHMGERRNW